MCGHKFPLKSNNIMGSPSDDGAAAAPQKKTQPHLMPQDASKVDPTKLCALTPEVVRLKSLFSL